MKPLDDYYTKLKQQSPERAIEAMQALVNFKPKLTYRNQPTKCLETFNKSVKFPKVLRQLFALVYLGKTTRIIIKAPRGGGKSQMMAMIGWAMWYFKDRSVVNMAGSEAQALEVYKYFNEYVTSVPGIIDDMPKPPTISIAETKLGNYFKCVTASPKQVRGPHPDILLADEVCETDDKLILAALPMVNSSENSVIILASTFHKVFGIFQDTWDNAADLGYTRFSWDIFDVVKQFDPVIWDDVELNRIIPDLQELKKLAAGKTGDEFGFIPIMNVIRTWQSKPTLEHFLVEAMGSRPSANGMVLDPIDIDAALFDPTISTTYAYVKGATCIMGIDWGFSNMTSVNILMQHMSNVKVLIHNKNYQQIAADKIIADAVAKIIEYRIEFVYTDSAGKFENIALQNAINAAMVMLPTDQRFRCTVIEVVFSKHKESMLGNMRSHFQMQQIKVPMDMQEVKWQLKRYHYQEGTEKPAKVDDHIPDSIMCALQHWPMNISNVQSFAAIDKAKARNGNNQGTYTSGLRDTRF